VPPKQEDVRVKSAPPPPRGAPLARGVRWRVGRAGTGTLLPTLTIHFLEVYSALGMQLACN
jgi:hypothetical protein